MEVINKREAWNKEKIAGQKLPPKPERPLANAVTLSDTDTLRDQAQIKSPLIPKKNGQKLPPGFIFLYPRTQSRKNVLISSYTMSGTCSAG